MYPKLHLLQRFHFLVILVNIIALSIDLYLSRYANAGIEASAAFLLALNVWFLYAKHNITLAAYSFLFITAAALFSLIAINHFATMSVVFILLLPLSTLLFLRLKQSLFMVGLFITIMAGLLYMEHLGNPDNPIAHNPQALFNLGYAAAIIYLFGILYHLAIIKTFDELDTSNRQKELLLGEVHHRVKNNLNIIASILGLQANMLTPTEREHLLKSKTRIEAMGMVHEMLYQSQDFSNIDVTQYFNRLGELLRGLYGAPKVIITINANGIQLPLTLMMQLGIITNELITNTLKYAFESHEGVIMITLTCNMNHYIYCYSDNGKGCDVETLGAGKSLGVKLVKLATRQLQGNLHIEHNNGLIYTIEFDYA